MTKFKLAGSNCNDILTSKSVYEIQAHYPIQLKDIEQYFYVVLPVYYTVQMSQNLPPRQ